MGKEKAKIAAAGNLSLGFPEFSEQRALTRGANIDAAVVRFQEWMEADNSPIRAIRHIPPRPAQNVDVPEAVDSKLRHALVSRGIHQLYMHQADAFQAVPGGRNVVIVTPTASGKTLCYNLPVLNRLLSDPGARAMYLFPTKAAARSCSQHSTGLPCGRFQPFRTSSANGTRSGSTGTITSK